MSSAWKIGVNSQAMAEIGSVAGRPDASGTGVRVDASGSAVAVGGAGAAARRRGGSGEAAGGARRPRAERRPTSGRRRRRGRRRRGPGERPAGAARSCRRRGCLPSGPGHSRPDSRGDTGRSAGSHPAAPQQAVLRDRLLGVARAGRLEAAAGRQPGEHDPVEPDQADPERLHAVVGPPRTPPRWRSRRPPRPSRRGWPPRGRAGDHQDVPAGLDGAPSPGASRGAVAGSGCGRRPAEPPTGRDAEPVVQGRSGRNRTQEGMGPAGPVALQCGEVRSHGEHLQPRRRAPRRILRP